MGFVSNGTDWGLGDTEVITTARAKQFFSPVGLGVAPGVTVGALSSTAQGFTNLATYYWNDNLAFNKQGQRWAGDLGNLANGCRNEATPRTQSGNRYTHITETEFLYTGQSLDIVFIGSSSYEVMVYIEREGRMYRAEATPRAATTSGLRHLPLNFGAHFHGRIRIVLAGGWFVGVKCEQAAIVKRAPDRIFYICDGAEWSEGAGFKQGSGTSYLCMGLTQHIFELTGMVGVQLGQPNTGYFRNNGATVALDTPNADNNTRFFSQDRKDWATPHFADKPLFYLITGSRQDGGGVSGATGMANGPMAQRAKACYEWIRSLDSRVTIAQLSVSPQGTGTGHDTNLAEQAFAMTGISQGAIINALSWFNAAQKTPLIGADGVNPNDIGFQFWAAKIVENIGQMAVNALRARRIK